MPGSLNTLIRCCHLVCRLFSIMDRWAQVGLCGHLQTALPSQFIANYLVRQVGAFSDRIRAVTSELE